MFIENSCVPSALTRSIPWPSRQRNWGAIPVLVRVLTKTKHPTLKQLVPSAGWIGTKGVNRDSVRQLFVCRFTPSVPIPVDGILFLYSLVAWQTLKEIGKWIWTIKGLDIKQMLIKRLVLPDLLISFRYECTSTDMTSRILAFLVGNNICKAVVRVSRIARIAILNNTNREFRFGLDAYLKGLSTRTFFAYPPSAFSNIHDL